MPTTEDAPDSEIVRIPLRFERESISLLVIGKGALEVLSDCWQSDREAAVLIGDQTVCDHFGQRVVDILGRCARRVLVLPFPPGEAHKTRRTKEVLEDRMIEADVGRRSVVVALGGGVSLDLAGFVAATYMRGVPSLYLPTSLLAQVDAAVGGKTGVNTPLGKNLVGAFHQPEACFIDPTVLGSLPPAEWRAGLAEMVKHAVIADLDLFDWIERQAEQLAFPHPLDSGALRRAIAIKAEIVCADEREEGPRAILNFGHTLGHAIEWARDFEIAHGLAVAMGMIVEARLAARRFGFPAPDLARLEALWPQLGFAPFDWPPLERVLLPLRLDKKNRLGQIRAALPERIGQMRKEGGCTFPVGADEIGEVWPR